MDVVYHRPISGIEMGDTFNKFTWNMNYQFFVDVAKSTRLIKYVLMRIPVWRVERNYSRIRLAKTMISWNCRHRLPTDWNLLNLLCMHGTAASNHLRLL